VAGAVMPAALEKGAGAMVIKLYKITINLFSSPRPFPVVLNCTTSQSIFRAPPGHALRYLLPEREMSFRRNISPSAMI
jgi:hypothetical protein